MKSGKILVWDLDSTLIDTNAVFERAQKNLLSKLSAELAPLNVNVDLKNPREFDILRAIDYEGIKIRGHPSYDNAYQLPLSLMNFYMERGENSAEYRSAWLANKGMDIASKLGDSYLADLKKIPEKFKGIEEVLELSKDNYNLLFTEYFEDKDAQYAKIKENGLEKYFDKIIFVEKKDTIAIASAVEYAVLENGLDKSKPFPLVFIDDRSKYLEKEKELYPFCRTVRALFNGREIFRERSDKVDYTARDIGELKNAEKI